MKKKLLLIFQVLVSLGLLVWLFRKQELRAQFIEVVTHAHPGWLAAGLLIAGIGNFLGLFRWGIFVRMLGLQVNSRDVFRIGLVGLFFNNFLVGAVGGDAVKVIWLSARGHKKSLALMSVAMDRMSGIMALIFCSLLFITPRLDWLRQDPTVASLTRVICIYLFSIAFLFTVSLLVASKGIAKHIPSWGPGRSQMMELEAAYRQYIEHWRQALIAAGVSVFMFVAYFMTFYCSARAFQVQVPVLDFLAFMPTVDIIAALPLSVGGFGVREHLFTVLLGNLSHVEAAPAVLVSLGGALLTMVWGLGGLLVLPSYRVAALQAGPEVAP
ncbi:MAG: lysylphosphatidylglycerol synthase transmembrane domain-containing protein [Chthoniobacterales bacterium]